MKVFNQKGQLLLDTGLFTEVAGQDVIFVIDQESSEKQEEILNVLKDIRTALGEIADMEFKEE